MVPRTLNPYHAIRSFKEQLGVPFFMEVIIIMAWSIWTVRNNWLFNNVDPSVERCRDIFQKEFATYTSPLPQKTRKYNKRKFAYDYDIVPEKQSRCPQIPIVENEFAQEQYTQTETHSDIASEAKRSGYEDTLPVYVKAVSPCNFRYSYMNIGKKFCTRNGLVTNCLMTLKDQEGRSWPLNLTLTSDQVRMKGGWGHFSGHHGIKVGDQCVFRLTDPNTFAVSINRAP
ncbi:hypothetical protein ACP70R_046998 [Stipagrostis hirtigluma subsp. patula]